MEVVKALAATNDTAPLRFDSFPYLVTGIVPTMFHITLLPDADLAGLREVASLQHKVNDPPTCLVLSPQSCLYYDDEGETASTSIPWGCRIVTDCLRPVVSFTIAPECVERLTRFAELRNVGAGYTSGDLMKGGREPPAKQAPEACRICSRFGRSVLPCRPVFRNRPTTSMHGARKLRSYRALASR